MNSYFIENTEAMFVNKFSLSQLHLKILFIVPSLSLVPLVSGGDYLPTDSVYFVYLCSGSVHMNNQGDLVKMLIQQVWSGTRDCAVLTTFQATLMLLVCRPHSE